MINMPAKVWCVERKESRVRALEDLVERMHGVQWAGAVMEPAQAHAEIGSHQADIVLLDMDLPGHNPFATVELLRHERPRIRTIVFSRNVQPEVVERAFAAGAWGFISKREGTAAIAAAIPRVMQDEYVMGPEVEAALMTRN